MSDRIGVEWTYGKGDDGSALEVRVTCKTCGPVGLVEATERSATIPSHPAGHVLAIERRWVGGGESESPSSWSGPVDVQVAEMPTFSPDGRRVRRPRLYASPPRRRRAVRQGGWPFIRWAWVVWLLAAVVAVGLTASLQVVLGSFTDMSDPAVTLVCSVVGGGLGIACGLGALLITAKK